MTDGNLERESIQGNVVGFNKDHQRFVFLQFVDPAGAREFLARIEPDLASANEVLRFNALFKEIDSRRGGEPGIVQAAWTNLLLTFAGLELIGAPQLESFPEAFRLGMAAHAALIGDVDASSPSNWVSPLNEAVHAMVILAADTPEDLEEAYGRMQGKLSAGVVELLPHQDGHVRPEPNRGREHFGFKDGISQPGIAGLTVPSKRSQDVVAPGEFLIGYPGSDGHVSGEGRPAPGPDEPGYPTQAAIPALPPWTKDGSFVVFRRLRQNVGAFRDFVSETATANSLTDDQVSAKLVGRWPSGAPLEHPDHLPQHIDTSAADPSIAHPSILSDYHINDFDYAPGDEDGHLVPRAAHIRKVNPRNENPPGASETARHRILRRGIPYGPEFIPTEPPYPGTGPVSDQQDRGLIFVCYQSSLERGFEFVQQSWANMTDFPQTGDGRDPIISQDVADREFLLTPQGLHLHLARWVTTTGGQYFFAPSIAAIKELGKPAP